ncbi:MAG: hypothetical protein EXS63_00730 [Candidatus Omnitrophica bacterium]|nr:hypothetical protein [Candidatus Omnitrophota bacterium]
MRFFRVLVLSLVAWCFFSLRAFALEIPEHPQGYISDYAQILSDQARIFLQNTLKNFESSTSHQIVVVTFPSLDGQSLEDFSIHLAEKWKVGQKKYDNGLILLIFKNDQKMRIEVGYGLESRLPDALCGQIIREVIAPNFKLGQYDQGVIQGVRAIMEATQGEDYLGPKGSSQPSFLFSFIVWSFLLFMGIDFARYVYYAVSRHQYPHRYGFLEWWIHFAIIWFILRVMMTSGGSYSSSSGGSSGGGGGGFSGVGGSFGGGGASGGW